MSIANWGKVVIGSVLFIGGIMLFLSSETVHVESLSIVGIVIGFIGLCILV